MPDYDHFLSDQELSSINSAHSILQGEDAEWLKRECDRVTKTMRYRLNTRGSAHPTRSVLKETMI